MMTDPDVAFLRRRCIAAGEGLQVCKQRTAEIAL